MGTAPAWSLVTVSRVNPSTGDPSRVVGQFRYQLRSPEWSPGRDRSWMLPLPAADAVDWLRELTRGFAASLTSGESLRTSPLRAALASACLAAGACADALSDLADDPTLSYEELTNSTPCLSLIRLVDATEAALLDLAGHDVRP